MRVEQFDFNLPEELIAQSPLDKRTNSKLLVLDKETGNIEHKHFYDIVDYLDKGDVLVLNETKVLPARIFGKKRDTQANIEVLLLKEIDKDVWESLVKPARRIKIGDIVDFNSNLSAECIETKEEGIRVFKLIYEGILIEHLEELGEMPLPPYITEKLEEKDRYQTVYAKNLGSSAAPTAGLHFTNDVLIQLKEKGVEVIPVTLHVGLGTFRPVSVDIVTDHKMHSETYEIDEYSVQRLNKAVEEKKKIIAVGTTSIRTLESNFKNGKFSKGKHETDIFIYPGYEFKVVDELITNFHLPKSSLIMLVSAFSTYDNIMNAYNIAINESYRFFSFGDSMYIKGRKNK